MLVKMTNSAGKKSDDSLTGENECACICVMEPIQYHGYVINISIVIQL